MSNEQGAYIAAYESHHVAHLERFSDYQQAAAFMHGWSADVHTWPVCIYNAKANQLWLWCGYRTMDISREAALEEARGFLGLPAHHRFESVEMMRENV